MDNLMTSTVKLEKIIDKFNLEILNEPSNLSEVELTQAAVNRPGLALSGFFDCFVTERIQVVGRMEHIYLEKMDPELRKSRLKEFDMRKPVAVVVARDIEPLPIVLSVIRRRLGKVARARRK